MNTEHTRDLALKMLGLYFITNAIINIPLLMAFFAPWGGTHGDSEMVIIALSAFLPIALGLFIGWFLAFRTAKVALFLWPSKAGETQNSVMGKPSLRCWIVLIGVYFFVRSAGGGMSEILGFFVEQEGTRYVSSFNMPSHLVTLVLAVICVHMAPQIETFLLKRIGEGERLDTGDL
ncbi:MAG: hypothetical protein H3C30_09765 [Candidatus Hydrogenedentes bacterium]|nr:hypothetical protein [Candidatus Hydrogenedentota bacterium]